MKRLRWFALASALVAGVAFGGAARAADTLSLDEAKMAAGAKFDKLEKDNDGTLDAAEVKGLIGPKTFKMADPDNDGTLSKDEYLALVETFFKKADVDSDGTVSVAELNSKPGMTLKKLMK